MCTQFLMGKTDDGLIVKFLIKYVTAHHFPETSQYIIKVINDLLIFSERRHHSLCKDYLCLQAVQLSAEINPRIVLINQDIAIQLSHMLRLFHIKCACGIICVFRFQFRILRHFHRRQFGQFSCNDLDLFFRFLFFHFTGFSDLNLSLRQIFSGCRR